MDHLYNDKNLKNSRRDLRRNQTKAECKLWHHLRNRRLKGNRFTRQYSVGKYILDFYCPKKKLAIEIDGGQHNKTIKRKQDKIRTNYLNALEIKVIRYWNNQVLDKTNEVLEDILKHLNKE
ncbi:endonuclease domain-containing protein [Candidatus Woesebacteria bacterium]|nr:endonuclease domain-containing protein [Candidatus Woesebacteria bacterium]